VACELDAIVAARGKPLMIVSDNGRASAVWPQTSLQPGPDRTTTRTDSGYE